MLDEFHLRKYLQKITKNFKSKQEEVEQELVKIIRKKTKNEFEEKIKELKDEIDSVNGKRRMEEGAKYLLGNWSTARIRLLRQENKFNMGVVCPFVNYKKFTLSKRIITLKLKEKCIKII